MVYVDGAVKENIEIVMNKKIISRREAKLQRKVAAAANLSSPGASAKLRHK